MGEKIVAPAPTQKTFLSAQYDKFVAAALVNGTVGAVAGVATSLIIFRMRRSFPIPLGIGFGAGVAYEDLRRAVSLDG